MQRSLVLTVPATPLVALLALLLATACKDPTAAEAPPESSSGVVQAAQVDGPDSVDWPQVEQRADVDTALDISRKSRTAAERRAAARALARIGGDSARARLEELLHDEDREVVRWALFGLASDCRTREAHVVPALLARSATLASEGSAEEREGIAVAVARALGRCGSTRAEESLRAWLGESRELAEAAGWGLGDLAAVHGHLTERTQVALLDHAAERSATSAFYAFTRLTRLTGAIRVRLLEVAGEAVTTEANLRRSLAVRALGNAGLAAAEPLGQILNGERFAPAERSAAAHALGRMGRPGQDHLGRALAKLLPSSPSEALLEPSFGPLQAALLALEDGRGDAREALRKTAELEVPAGGDGAAASGRRRAIWLRCRAADLLAGSKTRSQRLVSCDPDASRLGSLALVRVLDRAPIEGPRLKTFRELLRSDDPVVTQATLRLLSGHGEIPESAQHLASALKSETPGTVATALQVLSAYPSRGARPKKGEPGPDPRVADALRAVFDREDLGQAIEVQAAALDAVGALGLLTDKPQVEKACKSPHPELRHHAEMALGLLGQPKTECDAFEPADLGASFEKLPAQAEQTIEFASDVGTLTLHLDARAAPRAVGRLVELARRGFYDGLAVHRVVAGFVVQFGDSVGDGFGDGRLPPLRSERSPTPFDTFDVGMAIAGKDTATSQFFVTLARYPHLDGSYSRVGRAEGPWDRIVAGDVIHKARVVGP